MNKFYALAVAAAITTVSACDSDDNNSTPAPSEPGSFQVTFTNMTNGQLMTPPVVALHSPAAHLFEVGTQASDAIRDIAETGNNDALVAFAGANPDLVSAAGVAGAAPFPAGDSVTTNLTTTLSGQVFSAVNMVICTNDGIAGVDSIALPSGNEPVTVMAMAYDAGTRVNQADAASFFPPPCKVGDTVEAPVENPRANIAAHPGQSGLANVPDGSNWDFSAGDGVLQITITRN